MTNSIPLNCYISALPGDKIYALWLAKNDTALNTLEVIIILPLHKLFCWSLLPSATWWGSWSLWIRHRLGRIWLVNNHHMIPRTVFNFVLLRLKVNFFTNEIDFLCHQFLQSLGKKYVGIEFNLNLNNYLQLQVQMYLS